MVEVEGGDWVTTLTWEYRDVKASREEGRRQKGTAGRRVVLKPPSGKDYVDRMRERERKKRKRFPHGSAKNGPFGQETRSSLSISPSPVGYVKSISDVNSRS
jgi:hypothetical protein